MIVHVLAGESTTDSRGASSRFHEGDPSDILQQLSLEYKGADYFRTRQVVIVIGPSTPDPRDEEIARLRQGLQAAGISPGVVDLIQHGQDYPA